MNEGQTQTITLEIGKRYRDISGNIYSIAYESLGLYHAETMNGPHMHMTFHGDGRFHKDRDSILDLISEVQQSGAV
jgi:hypothetical protein